ncbi:hypothetical protein SLS62_010005 [Diatrype stigma]|uniref:Uncharacterized protein n=1 Tax=Diatrype stigma TaxID=117547 RepID=A0AAN9UBK5_9PEZI
MGRPRKRPREQTDEMMADIAAEPARAPKTIMTEMPPATTDLGMDFINFLTADLGSAPHFEPLQTIHHVQVQGDERAWGFGGLTSQHLGDLNFDMAPLSLSPPPQQQHQDQTMQQQPYTSSNIDPALFAASAAVASSDPPPSSDPVPGLSPPSGSASTPESSASSGGTAASCACTATLYLALDSMQKLPTDVTDGVRQARYAARTAWQVVNCPVCATTFEIPNHHHQDLQQHNLQAPTQPLHAQQQQTSPPAMRNFQNLMLLATLIPSIVHAYEAILAAVDRETAAAQRDRRRLLFRLHGLGGVWGPLGEATARECGVNQAFGHREMEPAMWRLTVRALLKLDVYGLSNGGACNNMGKSGPTRLDFDATGGGGGGGTIPATADGNAALHLGLKDIVTLMENRSRARHAVMDALVLSGAWPEVQVPAAFRLYDPGEPPTCQRIIALAKRSVERLVIA